MSKCTKCKALCCKYIALEIDTPTNKEEFDEIRWYVSHKNISVFIEDGKWYLNVDSRCKHITKDNKCAIYERRPIICRNHDISECEFSDGEFDFEEHFKTIEDVEHYMERRLEKKKKRHNWY